MIFQTDDVELHYDITGEGEPLLWVHGFSGAGADWRHVFKEPPPGFQVISPDLRGHGASTNPSDEFTFRQAALDVLALLRHLDITRVKAIGLSGGGIVLLHMATMEPARLGAIVAVSTPPYFPEPARAIQRQWSEAMLSDAEMTVMRERHTHGERQIQRLFAHARGFADSYDDVNFTPATLAMIAAETLIVFGDRDPLYPVNLAFELYQAIPRSYLWVVPNGGHGPIFGAAAPQFAATARSFLKGEWSGET
jgi:pimeloyl-ACP methyl ester carboxylesterase